ncbi:LacI family transcriptional regulator [Actinomyces sp. Z5]|uniref:LacI family DNA-binding transcriptional regulator n=1 Tax=Actinomyces sp. Z5 TaxID=2250216 RepID=UPI000DCDF4C4|nr:LacI family DNA-binding transcriptional regulator [Actinomyces sp. Z5]RAX18893.1 LacI family transcriptional regulator [Actinomyces sp. Z5]
MNNPPAASRTLLADVAARAGVSLATASKVANGRPEVSPATRARVEAAIKELGYVTRVHHPEETPPSISFMADVIESAYAMTILKGARDAAEAHSVDLVIERTHTSAERTSPVPQSDLNHRLLSRNRSGAVVLTASLDSDTVAGIESARLPIVVIDPLDSSHPEIVSVGATNWLGGHSAAEHLLGLGHTRLAILTGPVASLSGTARLDGFLSACSRRGLTPEPDLIRHGPFTQATGYQVAREWLSLGPRRPTAITAGSDLQAIGVMQAANDLGLRIPENLSLVSYDDTFITTLTTPHLTAVRQPLEEMGRRAVETVLLMKDDGQPEAHHIEIATTLSERASTAPPRG